MNNPNFQQNAMQQNAMQQQRVGVGAQTHFSQHYRQQLQLGKVPQGWQQSVSPDERANLAMQFCTQYRLLKPDTPEMEAMRASVNFESQNFLQAQTKDQYANNIKSKLMVMTNARQAHLQNLQANFGQPNNPMAGMNPAQMGMMNQAGLQAQRQNNQQFNPAFPNAQLQRPMQISPVPNGGQGRPGMGMTPGAPGNLNQAQNPPQQNMQQAQQSRQDSLQINQFAKRLMDTCKDEIRAKFQQDVLGWPEEKKQHLRQANIDPLFFRFRQHAEMMFKKGSLQQQGGNANGMNAMQQNGMQNQRPPNQEFDFNAIANQQMEAMRVQDQGATVVPASNNMSNPQMNAFQGQNQQQNQQQAAMAQRQAAEAAAFQNNLQQQHAQRIHQAQQQAQAQLQQERARQAQAAQARNNTGMLTGMNGGLNLPPGGNQSPAPMSMLNRPMQPPGQQMPPSTPQQQPQHIAQMTPQPGQMNNQQQMSALMREAQNRLNVVAQTTQPLTENARMSMIPPDIGPEVKIQLLKMPEQQFRSIVQQYNQRNRGMPNMQFPGVQPGQPGMVFNGQQQLPPGVMGGAMGNMGRPGLNIGQQPGGPAQQQMMNQPRPQMNNQQQRLAQAQHLLRTSPGIIAQTDLKPFPPNVLNQQIKNNLPQEVKTWHQLKQWANANPNLMPGVESNKLLLLQVLHFQDLVNQTKAGQLGGPMPQQNNMPGMVPPVGMAPNPGQMRTQQQQQQLLANMNQITVTPQDLQIYRQKLAPQQQQNMSDDQLKQAIIQHKLKARQQQQQQMLAQQAQQRGVGQPPQQQAPAPQQAPIRPPTTQAQNAQATSQVKPAPRPQPPTQPAQTNSANNANKGIKRPNEDAADGPTNNANAAPQAPAMVPAKSGPQLNLTQEQMSKMSPAQREQYKAQLLKAQQDASNTAGNKTQQQPRPPLSSLDIQARMKEPARLQAFKQLVADVKKSLPSRPPVPQISQEVRGRLQESLRSQMDNLKKAEQALRIFHVSYESADSTNVLRQIIQARALVFQQLDEKDFTLHDTLTLTVDEFRNYIRTTIQFVTKVMAKLREQQSQGIPQLSQQPQGSNQPPTPLNATNLKNLEKQQQQQKAPQAPTSDRPPFALGDQPVPGVPTYFQGAKTVTNLVLPDKKRTKLDPGSQTSTPGAKASPRLVNGKSSSPEMTRHQAPQMPQKPTFKCKVPDCEYSVRGFDTQSELECHFAQMHAKIENPMQFALEAYADFLDVDIKTGEPKVDPNAAKARPTKPANTARVSQPIKTEQVGTPTGAAATPMARVPTQPGMKSSPGNNLLRTPQTMAKVGTPSTIAQMKNTPTSMPRPMAKEPQLAPPVEMKEEEQQPLFAKSLLDYSYEDTFAALDANRPFTVLDLKDEDTTWALRSRPASPMTTPDSSAKDTPSTRTSDISENDNLQINLDLDMPDAWALSLNSNSLPLDVQFSEDMQALGVMLPPMDNDDMMLFPSYGDGMMDLDTLGATMDSMDASSPSQI